MYHFLCYFFLCVCVCVCGLVDEREGDGGVVEEWGVDGGDEGVRFPFFVLWRVGRVMTTSPLRVSPYG